MQNSFVNELPMSALETRYGITRSNVFARRTALKELRPELDQCERQEGRRHFICEPMISLLDQMAESIKSGLTIQEAARAAVGSSQVVLQNVPQNPALAESSVVELATEKDSAFHPFMEVDPLAKYRLLEEAAERGWLLSTGDLARIIGVHAIPEARYGFRFIRRGWNGREAAWQVKKLEIECR
jgi:hypothetical protein